MTAEIIKFVLRANPELTPLEKVCHELAIIIAGDALYKHDFPFCDLPGYVPGEEYKTSGASLACEHNT